MDRAITLAALDDLIKECHSNSVDHGFWDDIPDPEKDGPTKIALMHSELSEALEAMRIGRFIGDHSVTEELADTIIRIFDYAGAGHLPLADTLLAKMARNRERPYKHGGKLF
jgi:NTP pyrophosphatase (non-canonical NTP hydrolase)